MKMSKDTNANSAHLQKITVGIVFWCAITVSEWQLEMRQKWAELIAYY